MAEDDFEAELDAALADLDEDSPPKMAALESRADTQGVPDGKETVIDIDFTAGQQGTSDGFEEERAKERADYMDEKVRPVQTGGASSLGDRLLAAQEERSKRNGSSKTPLVLFMVVVVGFGIYKSGVFDDATTLRLTTASVASSGCAALPTTRTPKIGVPGQVWSDSSGNHHVAVLFRGYSPTKAMVDRIVEVADRLATDKAELDLWVSLDNTHVKNSTHTLIQEIENYKGKRLQLGREVRLHQYVEEDTRSIFPHLYQTISADGTPLKTAPGTIASDHVHHGEHTQLLESTLLWYKHPKVVERDYAYVWVVEDDVAFTGDIIAMVEALQDDSADLITHGCTAQPPKAPHHDDATTVYKKYVKKTQRFTSLDFVQRFSARLLNEFETCSARSVTTVQLEATCTLCHAAGLACDTIIDPTYIGDVYNDERTFMTPTTWSAALKNKPNKLFHPVG